MVKKHKASKTPTMCNHESPSEQLHTFSPLYLVSSSSISSSCHGRGMDSTIPTSTASSTVTTSFVSFQPTPTPFQILEISLISAQDLAPVTKSMRTYAVTWIDPARKLRTLTDQQGNTKPTWNQKLAFRVDNNALISEDITVTVEIYTVSRFRDVLVGTLCVLLSDLITPSSRSSQNYPKNTRFVALQLRCPSGSPQGILNLGVALLDNTMRSMPLCNYPPPTDENEIEKKVNSLSIEQTKDEIHEDDNREMNTKIQLWRSLSGFDADNEDFPMKAGSVVNGSMVNGSELCSDIGPSASVVAAEIAMKSQPLPAVPHRPSNQVKYADETESSIVEELTIEQAKAKGYKITTTRDRWKKKMETKHNQNDSCDVSKLSESRRYSRRNSDGGLFSCFGNAYGIEIKIVCGASNNGKGTKLISSKSRIKKPGSKANSA